MPERPRPAAGEAHELRLSLQFADATDRLLLPRHRVARWLRATLERPAAITVRVVDAAEGQALNRGYRRRAHPTNVLTFAYEQDPVVVADLVLCAPIVAAEAAAAGIAREAHYAHLLVHGALHAQGLKHDDARRASRMEARESRILIGLGFADPYATAGAAIDFEAPASGRKSVHPASRPA